MTFLPRGDVPWRALDEHLKERARRTKSQYDPERARTAIRVLTQDNQPDFVALGRDEFDGYVAFGFRRNGICILENFDYGNATYVFGENWEELSRRTKADLIQHGLPLARIVHSVTWPRHIRDVLSGK